MRGFIYADGGSGARGYQMFLPLLLRLQIYIALSQMEPSINGCAHPKQCSAE